MCGWMGSRYRNFRQFFANRAQFVFSFCFSFVGLLRFDLDNSNDNKFNATFLFGSFKTIVYFVYLCLKKSVYSVYTYAISNGLLISYSLLFCLFYKWHTKHLSWICYKNKKKDTFWFQIDLISNKCNVEKFEWR